MRPIVEPSGPEVARARIVSASWRLRWRRGPLMRAIPWLRGGPRSALLAGGELDVLDVLTLRQVDDVEDLLPRHPAVAVDDDRHLRLVLAVEVGLAVADQPLDRLVHLLLVARDLAGHELDPRAVALLVPEHREADLLGH